MFGTSLSPSSTLPLQVGERRTASSAAGILSVAASKILWPYYAKYARENFVNYKEVNPPDSNSLREFFNQSYTHSLWVLNKYLVDEVAANKLKQMCCG
ncbi:hypothetical protein RHGRI_003895 [Rhododendron griersonianum]|uniref:Uncharacterized protein n=1 Tax=Rhododendron griersonianum TaxID=479676 RepID=A0AAV6L6M1_9ERIC|nr:hypothetical protein RHGRI_003895 [Rhododendron griersonianum]KAG5560709.1 hypothetical protein RHGRI_003895 [Rhododendron griersonianum]KAG5560710.1 hypothetical protein RHGRI_003895 [Rhododendron griersonianum]